MKNPVFLALTALTAALLALAGDGGASAQWYP